MNREFNIIIVGGLSVVLVYSLAFEANKELFYEQHTHQESIPYLAPYTSVALAYGTSGYSGYTAVVPAT